MEVVRMTENKIILVQDRINRSVTNFLTVLTWPGCGPRTLASYHLDWSFWQYDTLHCAVTWSPPAARSGTLPRETAQHTRKVCLQGEHGRATISYSMPHCSYATQHNHHISHLSSGRYVHEFVVFNTEVAPLFSILCHLKDKNVT
jgi:hypothetical protein